VKILVKFKKNWADEFNCNGFKVYDTEQAWQADVMTLPELEYEFGTNEGWQEGEITVNDFTVVDISNEQAQALKDLFGNEFGIFPF